MKRTLALLLLAAALVGLHTSEAVATGCTASDIQETCCAAGCAAKRGPHWDRADEVLRACMRAIGCSGGEVEGASVFIKCECRGVEIRSVTPVFEEKR